MVVGFLGFHSEYEAFVFETDQSTLCDLVISRIKTLLTTDLAA